LSEQLYNELKSNGVESLELPAQNVLVGAFSQKAYRVRKQVFLTLKFGDIYIDQPFLVSNQLKTPMLIGYDVCITSGIILDFQRGKLVLRNDDESTEIEIMSRQEEARGVEDCYESLSNREVIAVPTPLTDPYQLAVLKLPHPLTPLSCEVYPCFLELVRLCKEGHKGTFRVMCLSGVEAGVEDNCTSEDCGIDDGNESLGRCYSFACSSEDRIVHDADGKCGVSIFLVAATDRVAGSEWKGYYNTV
jgi:hypothetical protein